MTIEILAGVSLIMDLLFLSIDFTMAFLFGVIFIALAMLGIYQRMEEKEEVDYSEL